MVRLSVRAAIFGLLMFLFLPAAVFASTAPAAASAPAVSYPAPTHISVSYNDTTLETTVFWNPPVKPSGPVTGYVVRVANIAVATVAADQHGYVPSMATVNDQVILTGGKLTVTARYATHDSAPSVVFALPPIKFPTVPKPITPPIDGSIYAGPINFKVARDDQQYLVNLSWSPPVAHATEVTRYVIHFTSTDFGSTIVGSVGVDARGSLATSTTVPYSQISDGGSLTVTAIFGLDFESAKSNAVATTSIANATAPYNPGALQTAPTPPDITGNIFGGGIHLPGSTTKNNPTLLETYGLNATYTHLINTYGTYDIVKPMIDNIAEWAWEQSAAVSLNGMSSEAYGVAKATYSPISQAATELVSTIGQSPLYVLLGAFAIAATTIWAGFRLKKARNQIYRGLGGAIIVGAGAIVYIAGAAHIVPTVVLAPVTGIQYGIWTQNQIDVPGGDKTMAEVKETGTFAGDAGEQAVRRQLETAWIDTGLVDWCQLEFGNAELSLKTKIPQSDPDPAYRGLSLCQATLKAGYDGNSDMQDRLRSDDGTVGIGGHTGYVEQASGDMWTMYSGQDPVSRITYAIISWLANLLSYPMYGGVGLMAVIMTVMITWDLGWLLVLFGFGTYPEFQRQAKLKLKVMGRRILTPAIIVVGIMTFQKIISAALAMWSASGWIELTLLRALLSLSVVVYVVAKIYLSIRHAIKRRANVESFADQLQITPDVPAATPAAIAPAVSYQAQAPTPVRAAIPAYETVRVPSELGGSYLQTRQVVSATSTGNFSGMGFQSRSLRAGTPTSVVDADPDPEPRPGSRRKQLELTK